ncbi:MAG: GNAT family N-acetyltransferase [Acidobacteria bacterium]|nr:GNAT family N-acetyltransferase [Acidobacteriota bacterium]
MIEIKRVTPETAGAFKDVRLRALKDSPTAFCSTHAKESQLPDEEWQQRADRWSKAENDAMFLALNSGAACGIVGSYRLPEKPERAQVISMWVDPAYRRAGVGKLLIDAVVEWNRIRGVRELVLMVTSVNVGAAAFYQRLGFANTGVTEPYPNDPSILEYEMLMEIPLIAP